MVKSFVLYIIVFFIIELNFHSSKNLYSSSIADAIAPPKSSTTRDAIGQVLIDETRTAHDYNNNNNNHHRHRRLNHFNLTTINNNNNVDDDARNINNNNNSASKVFEVERHNQQQRNSKNRQSHQTTKTPRMIQRLIGGHIKHPVQLNTEENLILSTTTIKPPTRGNFRRKFNNTSSTYRVLNRRKTTVLNKLLTTPKPEPKLEENNFNDDEAFLDDETKELNNWDNGILRLSAGAGKEDKLKTKKKLDSTKTLAEQVKDGKYGLIENEIFRQPPKRPGVISYLQNEEFPHDNEKSYGGLDDEDIWLAEDHLLVIKGGGLNEKDDLKEWPPIDDYEVSGRQIKIPSNPKIPPPFPVQLEENGPLQFIGNNKFTFIDPNSNESLSVYTSGNENYSSSETENNNEKNILTRQGTFENTTKNVGYFYPQANPISWPAATLDDNQTFYNVDGKFASTLENSTDYFDEDDPSLYYPPPYSFVYKNNYSNPVAPGPLVPGIILPPPPDSFSRLKDDSDKKQQSVNEIPFRQILTKISDYKTTSTNRHQSSSGSIATNAVPVKNQPEQKKEIIYAVTQPIRTQNNAGYYAKLQQQNIVSPPPTVSSVPEIISFVPKAPSSKDTLSKDNPIYYEYFEAKKTPATNPVYYTEQFTSVPTPPSTTTPGTTRPTRPSRRRQRVKTTTIQSPVLQQHNYVNKPYLTAQSTPLNYEDIVYITPKPEIRPNDVHLNNNNNFSPLVRKPVYKKKPVQNFEHEIDAIRQTLQYYNVEQLQNNNIPRTPKENPIHENVYVTTNSPSTEPPLFDTEPFKPMVKYSVPAGDVNGFKAMPYVKIDKTKDMRNQKYYNQPSTSPNPDDKVRVQILSNPTQQYEDYYSSSAVASRPSAGQQTNQEKDTNEIPITTLSNQRGTQKPWISIEKQVLEELNNNGANTNINTRPSKKHRRPSFRKIEPNSNQFSGYFYGPPQPASTTAVGSTQPRQNNRYYDEPFSNHIASIQNKLSEYQQPRPQQLWSLENDTYVNYVNPRPPINPHSEFISRNYQEREQYRAQTPPPPHQPMAHQKIWSLENDTYINFIPENRPPINPNAEYISQNRQNLQGQSLQYRQPYRQQPYQFQQQQQQRPWSLINDTYVNYVQPRPTVNPNSEFIGNRQQSQIYPQYYQQRPLNNYNGQMQRQPQRHTQNNGAVYPGHSYVGDTDVNYRPPYQQINPNSEFINQQQSQYQQQHYYQHQLDNQSGGSNNNYYQNRKRSPK